MATYIERGKSIFIPFKYGKSILDSQLKPRMYKSLQNFAKAFPKHNYDIDNIEVVEYAEVKHGEWLCEYDDQYGETKVTCSVCENNRYITGCYLGLDDEPLYDEDNYCPHCGAKMDVAENATTTDGGKEE